MKFVIQLCVLLTTFYNIYDVNAFLWEIGPPPIVCGLFNPLRERSPFSHFASRPCFIYRRSYRPPRINVTPSDTSNVNDDNTVHQNIPHGNDPSPVAAVNDRLAPYDSIIENDKRLPEGGLHLGGKNDQAESSIVDIPKEESDLSDVHPFSPDSQPEEEAFDRNLSKERSHLKSNTPPVISQLMGAH